MAALRWILGTAILVSTISCGPHTAAPPKQHHAAATYVDPAICASCHQDIAKTYRLTGMGRSFHSVKSAASAVESRTHPKIYSRTSDRYYTFAEHDGKLWQRRHQIGFESKETNVLEKQIDYVIGSGNHARTYLSRAPDGQLKELPVSWYAEKNGYWAMSPGYDRADQDDFRRSIPQECMFCHNGYPAVKTGSDLAGAKPVFPANLPEGIDCQRCHGLGSAHIAAVKSGDRNAIRQSIVNPAKLTRDRQMEVCMECHLETSSRPLPYSIRRYDRGVFSYRPGEPLSDYALHFDQKARKGVDRFEIAGAAYRLRQSACFRQSQMTCSTCHNPHDIPRGVQATQHYVAVCQTCHAKSDHVSQMKSAGACLDCHMPKRRAQDAVHTVLTDHFIQRDKPAGNLLAELPEPNDSKSLYRGEVVPYYPQKLSGDDELYLAVAQVKDGANLEAGLPRLRTAIAKYKPASSQPLLELANAYAKAQRQEDAIHTFEELLRTRTDFAPAKRGLLAALLVSGKLDEAASQVTASQGISSVDPVLLTNLGNAYLQKAEPAKAEAPLLEAARISPDLPETQNLLGLLSVAKGNSAEGESRFREAIRIQPDLALAHQNLANLLAETHRYPEAKYEFQRALAIDPNYIEAHHSYALLLELISNYVDARSELETTIRLAPAMAEPHNELADLLAAQGKTEQAGEEYRTAIRLRPEFYEAHLGLGTILARKGVLQEAREHFQHAALSADPAVRDPALKALGH